MERTICFRDSKQLLLRRNRKPGKDVRVVYSDRSVLSRSSRQPWCCLSLAMSDTQDGKRVYEPTCAIS